MFTQLCKQAWFVCLMVFSIGWSSVSFASANVMQISMQHDQMSDSTVHHTMMNNMSVQAMKAHCMDMQQSQHHNEQNHDRQHNSHSMYGQDSQNLKDCHIQLIQAKHSQHSACQDCALYSCQSSIVWFNSDFPKLTAPASLQHHISHQIVHQAQHLAGYWQEILRPPKA